MQGCSCKNLSGKVGLVVVVVVVVGGVNIFKVKNIAALVLLLQLLQGWLS